MRPSGILLPVVLLGAGCQDVTPPHRTGGYAFAHAAGFTFHWPAGRLPVRYWLAPGAGAGVGTYVREGIASWRTQLLYGEFDGMLVADSAGADVIVTVWPPDPPGAPLSDAPPTAQACSGITSFDVTADSTLAGPFRVRLLWDGRFSDVDIANCLHRVAKHELGHTLGILAHSHNALDLMAPVPVARDPTVNDRRTIEALYHTASDLGPPPP